MSPPRNGPLQAFILQRGTPTDSVTSLSMSEQGVTASYTIGCKWPPHCYLALDLHFLNWFVVVLEL